MPLSLAAKGSVPSAHLRSMNKNLHQLLNPRGALLVRMFLDEA